MSMNNKGLGRGLNALFGHAQNEISPEEGNSPFIQVSPKLLDPNPTQPRKNFTSENLEDLAASMRAQGVLQPLLVRPAPEAGRYQIIAGERRWRAALSAGLTVVPVWVRNLDDRQAMIVALIENIQREDLNPIEEAQGLAQLKDALGITQEELAEKVGQTRGAISNSLRLLRLDEAARNDLIEGRISSGHARCLLSLPEGDPAVDELRERIIETGMNVREAEKAASFWHREKHFPWTKTEEEANPAKELTMMQKNHDFVNLADQIGSVLNCRTKISGTSEKGRISLAYDSNEQLFELLEKLGLSLSS